MKPYNRLQLPPPTNPATHKAITVLPPAKKAGGNGAPKRVTERITGMVVFVTTSAGGFRQVLLTDQHSGSVLNFIKHRLHGGVLACGAETFKELLMR